MDNFSKEDQQRLIEAYQNKEYVLIKSIYIENGVCASCFDLLEACQEIRNALIDKE